MTRGEPVLRVPLTPDMVKLAIDVIGQRIAYERKRLDAAPDEVAPELRARIVRLIQLSRRFTATHKHAREVERVMGIVSPEQSS